MERMKRLASVPILICLLLTQLAFAQLTTCNVTGTVFDANGQPFVGMVITVHKVMKGGTLIRATPAKYLTTAGGAFSIPLARNSIAWIEAPITGFFVAGGVPIKVPDSASAALVTLQSNVKFPAEIPVAVPGGEGGGPAAWGNITGSLPNQTDLQTALNSKAASNHTHAGVYEPANANIQSHISSTANPHNVTKAQVGLGNVTNDAQLKASSNLSDLPNASTARTNLGLGDSATKNVGAAAGDVAAGNHNHSGVYEPANTNIQSHISATNNPHSVTKSQVGLGNVENTALSTWAGSANINTVGTIAAGTWQGTIIAPAFLGTGTRDGSKFLRDDGTWQAAGGGDSSPWSGLSNPAGNLALDMSTHTSTFTANSGDTGTARRSFIYGHNSSGTPAAGFGTGFLMRLESSTAADQEAAAIDAVWTTATHASRTSAVKFSGVHNGGLLSEWGRFIGGGGGVAGNGALLVGTAADPNSGSSNIVAEFRRDVDDQSNPVLISVANRQPGATMNLVAGIQLNAGTAQHAIFGQRFGGLTYTADVNTSHQFLYRNQEIALFMERNGGNLRTGVATSSPNSVLSVGGPISTPVASKTAAYTVGYFDSTVLCDATSAGFTITLPTAVGITGRTYVIKKTDSSGNAVTVDGNGSETIDGAATYSLGTQHKYVVIQSDGSAWRIIGNN